MKTLILTSYFSVKPHPNDPNDNAVIGRAEDGRVEQNSFNYIEKWYQSIVDNKLNAIVFYDNLDDDFVQKYKNEYVSFEKVEVSDYSNNDWRFFCFKKYLDEVKEKPDVVFHTDASDVVVVQDPTELVKNNDQYDFFVCKDSIPLNKFPYIDVHEHFNWDNKMQFLLNYESWDLINMGVVGGLFSNMKLFYSKFQEIRESMGQPHFNSDMWLCQYLLRSVLFDKKFIAGNPVCSNYKSYENDRTDVFFIHK
jgi:hypothetical protein